MGRKKEATLEDVRFEISRVCSSLNMIDLRLKTLAPKTNFPDIPPAWVLKAARANMHKTRHWAEYYHVLDDFYGLPHVRAEVDPKFIAVYKYDTNTIYSKKETMGEPTALHEYFHRLKHLLNISTTGEEEQSLADEYAKACLGAEKASQTT